MEKQNFELKNQKILEAFTNLKRRDPNALKNNLNLSWSNWGFGIESLKESVKRLTKNNIKFIELHGNHYGPDLGYEVNDTKKILKDYDIRVSGICGMFSVHNDLSSNNATSRQAAIDYIKREIDFAKHIEASYILLVPGAVGRPKAYDESEFERSVETIKKVAYLFKDNDIKGAIEPIRSAEVSFIHTIEEAKKYLESVDEPGIEYINGDVYHMYTEESHIGEAILYAGDLLTNLHLADSNRGALGLGSLDIDLIIMALYLIGYNNDKKFVTFEPLGPSADPYPSMFGKPNKNVLNTLVEQSVNYFREREQYLIN